HSSSLPLPTPPPPTSTLFPYTTLFRSEPQSEEETCAPAAARLDLQLGPHRRDQCSAHGEPEPGPRESVAYPPRGAPQRLVERPEDRKSTRLNSSHVSISYAVFCLKKKI